MRTIGDWACFRPLSLTAANFETIGPVCGSCFTVVLNGLGRPPFGAGLRRFGNQDRPVTAKRRKEGAVFVVRMAPQRYTARRWVPYQCGLFLMSGVVGRVRWVRRAAFDRFIGSSAVLALALASFLALMPGGLPLWIVATMGLAGLGWLVANRVENTEPPFPTTPIRRPGSPEGPNRAEDTPIARTKTHVHVQNFSIDYQYQVAFTRGLFDPANDVLKSVLSDQGAHQPPRCLVYVDDSLFQARPQITAEIEAYFDHIPETAILATDPVAITGGEAVKDGFAQVYEIYQAILDHRIDRHCYVIAIGGGAVLDAVGFAAATAHRGIRHIRVPTTVLGQNDSGVGVKNAVNFSGSKNYAGSFVPPWAVLNDFDLLQSLPARTRVSGVSEAVKVALIRDPDFFAWLEANAAALARFEPEAEEYMIRRSAELHMHQIAKGGDPFERGSARPLDFGHWAAHKLEYLTQYGVSHGDAVAIGIALDTRYSVLTGLLPEGAETRVMDLLKALGLPTWHPDLAGRRASGQLEILAGLEEFREHLGGELTITLLTDLGIGVEVHDMDPAKVAESIAWLSVHGEV